MKRRKPPLILLLLALGFLTVSCNKYSYYYRDQKEKDCSKETQKSHKYKTKGK
jgi:hypothetical protein